MPQITLLLHNIRSAHNVGSIFRSAEGFGVKKIICSGYTPYPKLHNDSRLPHIAHKLTAQIHKTALGAETMVPYTYYETLDAWLCENDAGKKIPIYGLEQSPDSTSLRTFASPSSDFALLLGEEVRGIESHYLCWCDKILEIPMNGCKESFNVSVAAGIALYALTSA